MRLRFEGYRGRYKYVFERNTTKTGEEKKPQAFQKG